MARKKIVFVIVEGPSDDSALGLVFQRLFDANTVYVKIMHMDITSDRNSNVNNIISRIGDVINTYKLNNHYENDDFKEIIHIVDTDGTYVSDDYIIEDSTLTGVEYSPKMIRTPNRNNIIKRNKKKSANMNKLYPTKDIMGIPYRVYYMSCNLDHVLYNLLNCSDDEKESNAHDFAKKYRNDIHGFCEFIKKSSFSVVDSYDDSWDFIKKDLHSLERYCNLGLCFPDE